MDNVTFLIKGCQQGAYKRREWAYGLFTVVNNYPTESSSDHYPFRIYQHEGKLCFKMRDYLPDVEDDELEYILFNDKPIYVEGRKEPILYLNEEIDLYPDDIPNNNETIVTTPGHVFLNWFCFVHSVKDKIPYQNDKKISLSKVLKKYLHRLEDNTTPDKEQPDKIYVAEMKKMLSAMSIFSSFSSINSKSISEVGITSAPGIKELRDKLLKENQDKLDDPLVITAIENQLMDYDRAYRAKDPYGGFYDVGKGDAPRMKMNIIQGIQTRMDSAKPPVLVATSLSEPMDFKNLPAAIDGSRSGSYSRGRLTALGGEAVKFIYRIYSAVYLEHDDCRTTIGLPLYIEEKNSERMVGRYFIQNGNSILITKDNIGSLLNKWVIVRSPSCCKSEAEGHGYCLKCFGLSMQRHRNSVASVAASVAQQMNTRFMKAMHASRAKTVKIRLDISLS